MTKLRIVTNGFSNGARALTDTLRDMGVDVSRVNIEKMTAREYAGDRLNLKWGCFEFPQAIKGGLINGTTGRDTLNKLRCFEKLAGLGVNVPDFTTSMDEAEGWGAERIYERHRLTGSAGKGIVIKEKGEGLDEAPLYVKGIYGHRREYRIHVFNGTDGYQPVVSTYVQQKKKRTTDVQKTTESRIRNLKNGWVFACKDIVQPRPETIQLAKAAVDAFGLHFGAVDIIEMEDAKGGAYVLEINCAPGLEGSTLFFYADAIKQVLDAPEEGVA